MKLDLSLVCSLNVFAISRRSATLQAACRLAPMEFPSSSCQHDLGTQLPWEIEKNMIVSTSIHVKRFLNLVRSVYMFNCSKMICVSADSPTLSPTNKHSQLRQHTNIHSQMPFPSQTKNYFLFLQEVARFFARAIERVIL